MANIDCLKYVDKLRRVDGAAITAEGVLVVSVTSPDSVRKALRSWRKRAKFTVGDTEVAVDLPRYPFPIYPDERSFLRMLSLDTFLSDFGILETALEKPVIFLAAGGLVQTVDGADADYPFVANARFYEECFGFFEDEIAVYHGTTSLELVVNVPEHGAFMVGYELKGEQQIPGDRVLGGGFGALKKFLESHDARPFLCKAIHQKLQPLDREKRYVGFLAALDEIVEAAQRDYEVFVTKFSFDELKENFRAEREEYFKGFRDTIKSLSGIAVSVPVSLAAAAFAVERVKSDPPMLWFVTAAYAVYTLIASYLVGLLHEDNRQTQQDLNADQVAFADRVKLNRDLVDAESRRIASRITQLDGTIWFLRVELLGLAVTLLFFAASLADVPRVSAFMMSSVVLVFHVLVWLGRSTPAEAGM